METCSNVLEEFFPGENLGGGDDASSEWLSIFVEDCLSSSASYTTSHPFPTPTTTTHPDPQSATLSLKPPETQEPKPLARGRPKRRKTNSRAHPYEQPHSFHADPPLLHQVHWLAESELVFPKKEQEEKAPSVQVGGEEGEEGKVEKDGQQPRRCTHCLSHRTPQWRAGPLGPKTLCNACGVRFKSGRLLPEYRPVKSPTFVSYKHSNSHKKVLEMRMALLSSHSN